MELSSYILGVMLGAALLAAFDTSPPSDLYDVDPAHLAELWGRERISPTDPFSLKHQTLQQELHRLAREFPSIVRLEKAGDSTEGRDIFLMRLGLGPQSILLWSQMHGDEPTATGALLDLAQFLGRHQQEPWVEDMLGKFTLLCVPMLNPDGAERVGRRNAQGIDINRDARTLQSPEGRLLKMLRDRYNPFLGFNLHNQNSLTTVGDTGKVATIALLAVASGRPEASSRDVLPGIPATGPVRPDHLAKRITVALYEALSPFVYGHISRYDEDHNPRAFGDNLTLWGTPIVLIESGGIPVGQPADLGVKLNFVGLLAALNSLSTGKIRNADPALYDALKMNSETPIFDLLLRNAWICSGTGVPLFKGDVAVRQDLRAGTREDSIIADVGDLGVFTAHETLDCTALMLTPGLIAWDPKKSPLSSDGADDEYLRKGILTVLETLPWNDLARALPSPERWNAEKRPANWSFVLSGRPGKKKLDALRLAEWLAAGGRAWIREFDGDPPTLEGHDIPGWFGVETISSAAAAQFQIPGLLEGDPATVLAHWTSEAARRFHLRGRGSISVGAVADMVLWETPSSELPADVGKCRPVRCIVNGHLVEPVAPAQYGRFLAR